MTTPTAAPTAESTAPATPAAAWTPEQIAAATEAARERGCPEEILAAFLRPAGDPAPSLPGNDAHRPIAFRPLTLGVLMALEAVRSPYVVDDAPGARLIDVARALVLLTAAPADARVLSEDPVTLDDAAWALADRLPAAAITPVGAIINAHIVDAFRTLIPTAPADSSTGTTAREEDPTDPLVASPGPAQSPAPASAGRSSSSTPCAASTASAPSGSSGSSQSPRPSPSTPQPPSARATASQALATQSAA